MGVERDHGLKSVASAAVFRTGTPDALHPSWFPPDGAVSPTTASTRLDMDSARGKQFDFWAIRLWLADRHSARWLLPSCHPRPMQENRSTLASQGRHYV